MMIGTELIEIQETQYEEQKRFRRIVVKGLIAAFLYLLVYWLLDWFLKQLETPIPYLTLWIHRIQVAVLIVSALCLFISAHVWSKHIGSKPKIEICGK